MFLASVKSGTDFLELNSEKPSSETILSITATATVSRTTVKITLLELTHTIVTGLLHDKPFSRP